MIQYYQVKNNGFVFKKKSHAIEFAKLVNQSEDDIESLILINSNEDFEVLKSAYLEHQEDLKRQEQERNHKIEEYRKHHSYQRKWSQIDENDDAGWRHFTKDDLFYFKDELLEDLNENYPMFVKSMIARIQKYGQINVNRVGGFNDFEPIKVVYEKPKLTPYEATSSRDLSGWLMPDGHFYKANHTQHSSVLSDLLELDQYKDVMSNKESVAYFSTSALPRIEAGDSTSDEFIEAARHLSQFIEDEQDRELFLLQLNELTL